MAYSKEEQYTVAVTYDKIRVPSVEQEAQMLGYGDEMEITAYPEDDDVESFTFIAYLDGSMQITIPKSIRQRFDFWDELTVEFDATGERWSPEKGSSARKAVYESAHPAERNLEAVTDIVADD